MPSTAESRLRHVYSGHEWRLSRNGGFTDASVFHLSGPTELYVKLARQTGSPDPGASPIAEAQRLAWLASQNVPCAEVADVGTIGEHEYLVTLAVPGRAASDDWPQPQRIAVADAVADFARELHALPVDNCPFDRRLKVTVPMAQEAAVLGEVDRSDLEAKRRGWSSMRLVTELVATARQVGREEPVVCHGDYCLPNILVDPQTMRATGIIDVGRLGVADRYVDLALMTRSMTAMSLNPQFGRRYADRFMYRYGELPADEQRIELYRLLDEFF